MSSPSSDLFAKDHLHSVYQTVNLSFNDLNYIIRPVWWKKERKALLKNVSGSFDSGQLIALMGPSGAGKTTLLSVLAGYYTRNFTGEIKVNGVDRNLDTFRKMACYIMQHDELMPHLTVQETMWVAANLKLSARVPRKEKAGITDEILKTMGLDDRKTVRVGNLSGGQKKRLSIAQELVNNPPLMFFDEPTSGLDSQTSFQVISVLKELSKEGRTIICTIHQPSAKLFEMFDELYLMADGLCLYRGPVAALLPYLKSQGLECPPYHNPADFVIEVTCGLYGDVNGRLADCVRSGLCEELAALRRRHPPSPSSIPGNSERAQIDKTSEGVSPKVPVRKKARRPRMFAANTFTQFQVLFMRSFRSILRDPNLTHLRFISHVAVGLLIGGLYYQIGNNAEKARDNAGFLFLCMLFLMFTALMPTVMTFPLEMNVFVREHLNSWYSLRSYYFAKAMADMPFQFIFPTIYCVIVYFMTGQPLEADRFFLFILFTVLVSLAAQSSGLVISAATPLQAAIFLGPVTAIPILLFSGFFVTFDTIPDYMKWLSLMSYVRYGFEGLFVSIYGNNRSLLDCPSNKLCVFQNASAFMKALDMEETNRDPNMGILVAFFFIFRIICYCVLRVRVSQRW